MKDLSVMFAVFASVWQMGASVFAANLIWDPARTNGASDGSGIWDLSTANWWNGTNVASWANGGSATFGNGGAAGTVSVGAAITVSNLTFNAPTNNAGLTTPFGMKPVVAYMSTYAPNYLKNSNTADFVFSNITHLVYVGAWTLNTAGSLVIDDASALSNIVAITHAHGRKVMFTIGDGDGSTDSSGKLIQICTNAIARAALTTNILRYCQQHNLDGVDFDWEFPPAFAVPPFVTFLQELRAAAPPGFLISVAVMTGDAQQAQEPVDWFYLMAYTFTLDQVLSIELNSWIASGVPLSKLVLGMGLFGVNSSGGALGYSNLIGNNNIDPSLDSYNGYTFTGINTVKQLTRYVYNNALGGIGWFRIELDTLDNRSLMLAGATQARACAGAFGLGDGYLIQDGTLTLSDGTTFTANGNATINSVLAGTNGWTKLGPGTLVLGGNNSFSGGKNINAGTVKLSNGSALGRGGFGVYVAACAALELAAVATYDFNLSGGLAGTLRSTVAGATLQATNYKNQQLSNTGTIDVLSGATLSVWDPVWGSGGFTKTGGGILYLFSNSNTITGPITINGGILQIGGANAANINGTNYGGNIVNNGLLDIQTTTSQTLSGLISGTGRLTKAQNSTLILSRANTYSGGTTISGGTLKASSGGALGTGMLTMSGGVLDMGGFGLTTGGLQGTAGRITSGGYAITLIVNQSSTTTYAGILDSSGTLSLIKAGAGMLTLSGTNTYSGATTINNGTLIVNGSLANTPVTVTSAGKLGGTGIISGAVTVNGTLAPGNSAGTLTIKNNLTLAGSAALAFDLGFTSDRVNVTGNLTLAGTLNFTDAGGFGVGTYTLFTYTGTLKSTGMTLGATPNSSLVYTLDTNTTGQVKLVVTYTPFVAWQMARFGFTNGIALAAADPDGDGLANLMEYALGLYPLTSNANPIVFDRVASNTYTYLRLSVPRDSSVTNILIEGLSSGTLTNWTTETVIESSTPSLFRVRDALPIESNSQRFLRLHFSLP